MERRSKLKQNDQNMSQSANKVAELRDVEAELKKRITKFRKLLFKLELSSIPKKGSFQIIKEEAIRIANFLVLATNQQRFPIKLYKIQKLMLIHSIFEEKDSVYPAQLIPDEKGFLLKLIKSSKVRDRATIAHEIGHTLFYDTSIFPPRKILRYNPKNASYDKEEWVAWDFARELLLPRSFIGNKITSEIFPLPLSEIIDLARKFEVSIELLCHRLIRDCGFWDPCAFLVFSVQNGKPLNPNVFRTSKFPKFPMKGKKGLINLSSEFTDIVNEITVSDKEYDSRYIEFDNVQLWIKSLRYSENPQRIISLLELPFFNLKSSSETA